VTRVDGGRLERAPAVRPSDQYEEPSDDGARPPRHGSEGETYCQALSALIEGYEASGEHHHAIRAAQGLLEVDPLDERATAS
jgi:hypothetical protein